jgi:hypothetical protein
VKEYDIYIPLNYNDGTPIDSRKFQKLQRYLLDHFGGVTYFPQPNKGLWKLADVTYRDEIVIYRVIAISAREARQTLKDLKEQLLKELEQEEILIVERDVETL